MENRNDDLTVALQNIIGHSIRPIIREEVERLLLDLRQMVADTLSSQTRELEEYISVGHAARFVGVKEATVRDWIKKGYLQEFRAGRLLRVQKTELERFLLSGTNDKKPSTEKLANMILGKRVK